MTQFEKRSALDDDGFNVVIGLHIINCHCLWSIKFCSFTKRRQRLLYHLKLFEIQVWFGLNVSSAVITASRAQEKSCSHVEQKMYISSFFDFPKHGNIPSTSDRTFLVVVDRVDYYCHLSQSASLMEKTTAMRSTTLKYYASKTLYLKLFSSCCPKCFPDADR